MAMMQNDLPNLHEYLDQEEGVNQDRFTVDNDEKANWVLRKMKQIEDKRMEDLALAQAEIDKIESWMEQVNKQADNNRDYFQSMLAQYAFNKRMEDPKFKTLKLPNGKLAFRKQQPKWNYDNDKVVQALKEAGYEDLIKVKEDPIKAEVKKKFAVHDDKVIDPDTGEVLEGVSIEYRDDAFKVEVE
ncbi:host-nuclease inhibitor Gam family protein [Alteribacter populi]|uniref:host-nuclease inhibitor Gam family protein n=1 Tax=Alteribacter populi TaxID=2011011 RepID=UPI000BBA95E0|nr:host-nuclease inhibitor Gam family protein [Alteribacter populi]